LDFKVIGVLAENCTSRPRPKPRTWGKSKASRPRPRTLLFVLEVKAKDTSLCP